MDILRNLADPAVLFFFLGLFVGAIRSNLEIPPPVAKFLSLYLLMALGYKGGNALRDAGLTGDAVKVLVAALVLAMVIPAVWFLVLRRRINAFDAAAIAATYGSVSAVTFVTASKFVESRGDAAGGYLTVALVIMESPAIVMAVLLASWARTRNLPVTDTGLVARGRGGSIASLDAGAIIPEAAHASGQVGPDENPDAVHGSEPLSMREVLREAFTDGAHLLLLGSMVVGAASDKQSVEAMLPFTSGIFKGLLAFFLLEMGLLVARQLRDVRDVGPFLLGFGVVVPFVNGGVALAVGSILGLGVGDMTLLAVLAASGSYIVVPAVVRYAIPEARPSRYFTLALGVTFPVNIAIGIPLYHAVAVAIAG